MDKDQIVKFKELREINLSHFKTDNAAK